MMRAAFIASGLLAAGGPAAAATALDRLPGWDAASVSAGCLAAAASARQHMIADGEGARPALLDEGDFWRARLESLSPDPAERMEYWEAAHEWLEDELSAADARDAYHWIAGYRALCRAAESRPDAALVREGRK